MAVERVRSRQSQSEEAKEEPSVLVSQVLNPEMPLNPSGNIRKVFVSSVTHCYCEKTEEMSGRFFVFLCMCFSGRINSHTSRIRKSVSRSLELDGSSVASLSGDQSSLGLLQTMLGQVEADLDSLSPDTEQASAQSQKQHRTQGLTGFSVALVSTLGRLVHLLKQVL